MGEVWSAVKDDASQPIALKLVQGEGGSQRLEMFADEGRAALSLRHPHIIRTFELGQERDVGWISMELVAGPAMSVLLQASLKAKRPVPPALVAYVGRAVASALHYAHVEARHEGRPLRLIHRDVTPHNILLDTRGRVLLTDFGVARTEIQQHRTSTGVIRGKPAYMSPEQASEAPIDHRSDLFSLGIVLYEMAGLRRLFGRGSMMASLQAVTTFQPAPLHVLVPGFPQALSKVIARMLEKDREQRTSSAQEIADNLRAIERSFASKTDPAEQLATFIASAFPNDAFDLRKVSTEPGTITTPDPTDPDGPRLSSPSLTRPAFTAPLELTWPTLDETGAADLPPLDPIAMPRSATPSPAPVVAPRPSRARPSRSKSPVTPILLGLGAIVLIVVAAARLRSAATGSDDAAPKSVPLAVASPERPAAPAPAPVRTRVLASDAPPTTAASPASGGVLSEEQVIRLVQTGDADALRKALSSGTPARYPLAGGRTSLLHEAIKQKQHEVVEVILELGADPNEAIGPEGYRPLHVAAMNSDGKMIATLIAHRAAVEGRDAKGDAALHKSASIGRHADSSATQALIGGGASPNAAGQSGRTPTIVAVINDDLECLGALLAHGANVEVVGSDGATALWHAAQLGRLAAVEKLIAAGAGQRANSAGVTPLAIATERGHAAIVVALEGKRTKAPEKVVLGAHELPMGEVANPSVVEKARPE
jgi:eukaryotic-like serine/threonine-protein kinase